MVARTSIALVLIAASCWAAESDSTPPSFVFMLAVRGI
jgi:hypothetical protein